MKLQKSIIALFALFIFALTANAQLQYRKSMDFDGDNKADLTVMRQDAYNAQINGYQRIWYTHNSSNNQFRAVAWGFIPGYHEDGLFESDQIAPGDYDGDGKADYAAIRLVNNQLVWHILSNNGANYRVVTFGFDNGKRDTPMAADYDGDGKTDIAVARTGLNFLTITWHILRSSDGQYQAITVPVHPSTGNNFYNCKAIPGDYDGDGKADLSQYCYGAAGLQAYFKTVRSSDNVTTETPWGTTIQNPGITTNDKPVAGDYDGDGKTDLAVVRRIGSGEYDLRLYWYIKRSSDDSVLILQFGAETETIHHLEAAADYDGDGKTDIAVYDIAQGLYYILQSSNGQVKIEKWGIAGDIMLTNQPYNIR